MGELDVGRRMKKNNGQYKLIYLYPGIINANVGQYKVFSINYVCYMFQRRKML